MLVYYCACGQCKHFPVSLLAMCFLSMIKPCRAGFIKGSLVGSDLPVTDTNGPDPRAGFCSLLMI